MKLFSLSYIVSVLLITIASFPSVMAAPLDIFPRICFYFGLPGAVLLSIVFIVLDHLMAKHARAPLTGIEFVKPADAVLVDSNRKAA